MDINIFSEAYFWLLGKLGATLSAWFWGLIIVPLVVGHFVTERIVSGVRSKYLASWKINEIKKTKKEKKLIPAWIVGSIERLFFTIAIAYNLSATIPAMIGWITVKMLQKWRGGPENKNHAFSRLLGGMVSMLFALIGGLLIRYLIDP